MTILEKFKTTNIFEEINKIEPLPWKDFTYINVYWLNNFGSRKLLPTYESENITNIANVLSVLYSTRWKILYDNLTNNFLLEGNSTSTTTTTTTDNNDVSRETSDNSTHKVSGFDEATFSDESEDVNQNSSKETGTRNKTVTTNVSAKNGNYTNDFIHYNSFLTKTDFFDMIITDINIVLTIQVQECDII